jgi:tRNA threonylcarbamoyladenosine biosynthesis protein TsaB
VTLTLAIDTSSMEYGIALCTRREIVAHRSVRRDDPSFQGLGELVTSCLGAAGGGFADVERIAVDVGPGYLGSVRVGVSYANGLAFSLGRMVLPVDSLRLLAREAAESGGAGGIGGTAILCLRQAGGGDAYAGLFRAGAPPRLRHGRLASVVTALAGDLTEVAVAGAFRPAVGELLPNAKVKDTGVDHPTVLTLARLVTAGEADPAAPAPFASPLDDSSPVFGKT